MERDRDTTSPRRGRIVMLVDNGVNGDSRVQKTARSAAEAGWDVTLLGVAAEPGQPAWRIGDAEVQLIHVWNHLVHPVLYRRSVRRPLAYPPGRTASARIKTVKAWRSDLELRRARLELARQAGGPRWREVAGKGYLVFPRLAAIFLARLA